jgi:hypothetical protein
MNMIRTCRTMTRYILHGPSPMAQKECLLAAERKLAILRMRRFRDFYVSDLLKLNTRTAMYALGSAAS